MAINTRRRDTNFFTKLEIFSTSFDVSAKWNFISTGFSLMVESDDPDDIIEYSFDGTNVHGDLTPLLPSSAIIFDNRFQSQIWFRRVNSGLTGAAIVVRVEAWRSDS